LQASTSTTTSTTAITDITNAISKATEAPADEEVKTPETPPPATAESTDNKILLASISQTTGGETGTFGATEPTVGAGDTAITRTEDAAPAGENPTGEKTPANAEEKKEASKDKEKEEKKERPARDEKKQEGRAAAKKVAQCS